MKVLASLVVLVLALGCGPPVRVGNHRDGGGGQGGGGPGGNGGNGGGGPAGDCTPGSKLCDGPQIRTCGPDGKPGPVDELCTDACSAGRCTSSACADAEKRQTFVGCRFYTFDVDNAKFDENSGNPLLVLVANPGDALTATVKLESRSPGDPWLPTMTAVLPPGEVEEMLLADRHLEGAGIGKALAWRLSSDAPIVAYHIQSGSPGAQNSGGTMLIPSHSLGRSYMPITAAYKDTDATAAFGGKSAPQVAIVGTKDGTHVSFTVSSVGSAQAGGGEPARGPGAVVERTVDEGDVLQIYGVKEGDDLTGSVITSDAPIAVFSGNQSTSYGIGKPPTPSGPIESIADMIHEQMLPLTAWGKSYVGSGLPSLVDYMELKDAVSIWRVLASEDGTAVTVDAPAGATGAPAPFTLDRGAFRDFSVRGPDGKTGHFLLTADRPVLMVQMLRAEPSMALAVPAEQLLSDFLFVAGPEYANDLAIVRKAGSAVTMDGMPLADAIFAPAGGGFEVGRVLVPRCASLRGCGHRLRGTSIGVLVRGEDPACGYAYVGGMGVRCVNKTAGCY